MLGAYPIGSIYLSVNNTSPASLFGGTWEKIQDRFLLASGSSYSLGATGGEKEHTLTISEMPSHYHNTGATNHYNYATSGSNFYITSSGYPVRDITTNGAGYTGGDNPHNNMPPYLVVNVWKRIS